MTKANYGIVAWYLGKKKFDFEDYAKEGTTRDKVKSKSANEFYSEMMKYAEGLEPENRRGQMKSLSKNTKFKNKSKEQIQEDSDFDVGANELFDGILNRLVVRTELPDHRKDNLIEEIPDYDEEVDFQGRINEVVRDWEKEIKEEAERFEEYQEEAERLTGKELEKQTKALIKETKAEEPKMEKIEEAREKIAELRESYKEIQPRKELTKEEYSRYLKLLK